jgi:hypothetical protein
MPRKSIQVLGKTFTFGTPEEETEAYTAAKRWLRAGATKAMARATPKTGTDGYALVPHEGPGRRSKRQYESDGELLPENPHWGKTVDGEGNVKVNIAPARIKLRTSKNP